MVETNFYNVFRNTIRILLNDYENIKMIETIESVLNKTYIFKTTEKKSTVNMVPDSMSYINNLIKFKREIW